MGKSNKNLLEREVNDLISKKVQSDCLLVLRELRFHPCEMDIVIFDPKTLRLAALEIKRINWKELLRQTIRAKLYCHFSVAVMPVSMRHSVPLEEFAHRGIGVFFYEASYKNMHLSVAARPKVSNEINRSLKKQIYREFYSRYGERVHA